MINNTIKALLSVLNFKPTQLRFVNRNHNYAEEIEKGMWVHRKGATHANKGMLNIIPSDMVEESFNVEGLGNESSMRSSSQGVRKVLSRRQAKETLSFKL